MSAHNDSAFLRMFLIILGALVAFTVLIMIAANLVIGSAEEARGPDPRLRAAIAERIEPVGRVNVASAAPQAAAAPKSGADVVAAACNSCHGTGVLQSPKIGDSAAWQQRFDAQGGLDGLTRSAIAGKGAMPPKGGAMVSDGEIRAAVEHMLSESGVTAGAAPAAAAAAPAPAESAPAEPVVAAEPAPAPPAEPAAPAADLGKGKAVYSSACFVCHATGAAGAPRLGDQTAWAPRIAQGMDALVQVALNGKNAMPPKGGRMDLSDADVAAAVAYMVDQSD